MDIWTTRANDRSLEYLILLGRLLSVAAGLAALAFTMVVFWARDEHTRGAALASLLICLALTSGLGFLSWVSYGNKEWHVRPLADGARWGDLQCNVQLGSDGTHPGEHWDSRLDPRKEHLWS